MRFVSFISFVPFVSFVSFVALVAVVAVVALVAVVSPLIMSYRILETIILNPHDRKRLRHVKNQASWNASLLDFLKVVVDIFELASLIDHVSLVCCMQFKHLSEIQSRANNRANDVDPIKHRLENGQLHRVVGWQRHKDKGTTSTQ